MTSRERWVIYPLVFLALGFALKPKFMPTESLKCSSIECDQLKVNHRADVGEVLACGAVQAVNVNANVLEILANRHGQEKKPVLVLGTDAENQGGIAMIRNSAGQKQVVLNASPAGGQLRLEDASGQVLVFSGHLPRWSGISVIQPEGSRLREDWVRRVDRALLPILKSPILKLPKQARPNPQPPEPPENTAPQETVEPTEKISEKPNEDGAP